MKRDLKKHSYKISSIHRQRANKHKSFLVFFTGLSGSGKSTLANGLEQLLFDNHVNTYVLDGDDVRLGINRDLSFTPLDRSENIRRVAEISRLFIDAGIVVLAAFIAPYKKNRDFIKKTVGNDDYFEVFVNTSLETCEGRDFKGLYKKAREGKINNMTGISSPYEIPENPDMIINEGQSIGDAIDCIYNRIEDKLILKPNE